MATQTWWVANGQSAAQVETITISAVASGAVFTGTINGKSISYAATGTDTTATAASAWAALLNGSGAPPEFQQVNFTASSNVVTLTARTAGTPFVFTSSATGGGTISQAVVTANSSASDVNNPANWLRNNSPSLPQDGDDVILANSAVPLLWNLDQLAAVRFNSLTRWQTQTGQIGLPAWNPLGYWEYLPTYFQFSGNSLNNMLVTLGQGQVGNGPPLEQYNVGSQLTTFNVRQSGSPSGTYAVRLLGTNGGNTIQQTGSSVAVAEQAGETAALASAMVDGGGSLSLGNVIYGESVGSSSLSGGSSSSVGLGKVTCFGGTLELLSAPGSVILDQAAVLNCLAVALNFPSLLASGASRINWLSSSSISNLILQNNSIFDKSGSVEPITISASTFDASCQALDPNNAVTWQTATAIVGAITSGIFTTGRGRSLKVT